MPTETYQLNPQVSRTTAATQTATYAPPPAAVRTPAGPSGMGSTTPSPSTFTTVTATAGVYHNVVTAATTSQASYGPSFASGPAGNVAYGQYYSGGVQPAAMYGDYLARQYGEQTGPVDLTKYIGQVGGRSQFDWQREQVAGQFDAEQQRQIEQLDAALAAQGVTGGAATAARNDLIRQLAIQRAGSMNEINAQESGFLGEAAMTEQAQRFERGQQLTELAFTAETTYATLNQREKELSENSRQFDNKYDFDVWAEEQGYTNKERDRVWNAMQKDEDRNLTAQDLQLKIDDMRNSLALDYEELATTVGVERDKLQYNIWAKQNDIASAERSLVYRAWSEQQLTTLESNLIQGRFVDQAAITQRQTAYFNIGKSGQILEPAQLDMLRTQDPLAYYAYLDGQAGLSQAIFDANLDTRDMWLRGAVAAMSDLSGDAFISAMGRVFTMYEDLFGEGGQFSGQSLLTLGLPMGIGMLGGATATSAPAAVTFVTAPTAATITSAVTAPVVAVAAAGDAAAGYVAPLGKLVNGMSPYGTPSGFGRYVDGASTVIGRPGELNLWRGRNASGAWPMNEMEPSYTYGSPEATAFLANIASVRPEDAWASAYLYDDQTLREAADKLFGWQNNGAGVNIPATLPSITVAGGPTPRNYIYDLMRATGRGVNSRSGSNEVGTPADVHTQIPASQYQPVDVEYLEQLAINGDITNLLSFVTNGTNSDGTPRSTGGFVNIGGQPFVMIQSIGKDWTKLNGVTLISALDPTYTIDIVTPGTAKPYNPCWQTGLTAAQQQEFVGLNPEYAA